MNFHFDIRKATEVATQFISREQGQTMNVMKLIKLIYLLDRLSVKRRSVPVVGGVYYSMRNGPVTSELLDLVNAGKLADEADSTWEESISDRVNHDIALKKPATAEYLSNAELQLLDEVYNEHGGKDQWQLRDWCHQHCGEWTPLQNGRERIDVEELAINVGKTEEQVRRIASDAKETKLLAAAFASTAQ